jgi:hypothetical protein
MLSASGKHPIFKTSLLMHIFYVAKHFEAFGKYVRLILTGEIVEVLNSDSTEIMINYRGKHLTIDQYDVSRLTSEEAAAIAKRISGS